MVLVHILEILKNNRFIEKQTARAIFRKDINRTDNESYDVKTVFYEIYQEYRTRISSRYIFGESKVLSFMNIRRFHKKQSEAIDASVLQIYLQLPRRSEILNPIIISGKRIYIE